MVFRSRPHLIPVALLFVVPIFAAPTEPLVDGDHFRYLEREELGPFPQDNDPKLSSGGAQFRSRLSATLRRAVSAVPASTDNKNAGGLNTGIIVLIAFASVFGAVALLGCASLVLAHRARRSAKIDSHSTFKGLTPNSPMIPTGASMLSGSTLASPTGTMDGRTLMQVLADAGLPVPRHPLSNRERAQVVPTEKPRSPVHALLRSPFGFRAGTSRRSSTSSRILVIDQKSAVAAGAVFVEKPAVPPVLAVSRLVSCSTDDGAKHDGNRRMSADQEAPPVMVPHKTASLGPSPPRSPSRQQTMQSICSTASNDSIPPCPPVSPSADVPPFPTTMAPLPSQDASFTPLGSTSIARIAPKPTTNTPPSTLRVVNLKPKRTPRTSAHDLSRTVVQRNMLHLAHSSRIHATAEPVQHPFAASAIVSNGLPIHAPRPETLLRPPALRVNTTGLPVQGI